MLILRRLKICLFFKKKKFSFFKFFQIFYFFENFVAPEEFVKSNMLFFLQTLSSFTAKSEMVYSIIVKNCPFCLGMTLTCCLLVQYCRLTKIKKIIYPGYKVNPSFWSCWKGKKWQTIDSINILSI